jgi:hypothetical protein
MGLVVKVVLALGIDGLARWAICVLVTFVLVSLAVVLTVVQTVSCGPDRCSRGQRARACPYANRRVSRCRARADCRTSAGGP